MNFINHDVTLIQAELDPVCKRVHKLILVREMAKSPRLGEMNHL